MGQCRLGSTTIEFWLVRLLTELYDDDMLMARLCHSDKAGKLQFSVCGLLRPVARQSIELSAMWQV